MGDVEHSRVARSDIHALLKLGAKVTVCGPSTLVPRELERYGVGVTHRLKEALEAADVVYSLRIQLERQAKALFPSLREYIKLFRIDAESLRHAPDHAIVMHPGPINRDLELSNRGRRRAAQRHPPAGDQRRRRAHGGHAPAGEQRRRGEIALQGALS